MKRSFKPAGACRFCELSFVRPSHGNSGAGVRAHDVAPGRWSPFTAPGGPHWPVQAARHGQEPAWVTDNDGPPATGAETTNYGLARPWRPLRGGPSTIGQGVWICGNA